MMNGLRFLESPGGRYVSDTPRNETPERVGFSGAWMVSRILLGGGVTVSTPCCVSLAAAMPFLMRLHLLPALAVKALAESRRLDRVEVHPTVRAPKAW